MNWCSHVLRHQRMLWIPCNWNHFSADIGVIFNWIYLISLIWSQVQTHLTWRREERPTTEDALWSSFHKRIKGSKCRNWTKAKQDLRESSTAEGKTEFSHQGHRCREMGNKLELNQNRTKRHLWLKMQNFCCTLSQFGWRKAAFSAFCE